MHPSVVVYTCGVKCGITQCLLAIPARPIRQYTQNIFHLLFLRFAVVLVYLEKILLQF